VSQQRFRPRVRSSEEAIGQVVGFMIAGSIFVVALAGILLVSRDAGDDSEAADGAKRDLQASSLLDVVAGSAGVGWGDPDTISRLGLQATNGTGLNAVALQALRGASYDSTDNNLVDYAEARESLDIPEGTDFHLRMYPVGLDSSYQTSLAGTRVAYVGHWLTLSTAVVASGTSAAQLASAQSQFNGTIGPRTQAERLALENLGVDFTNVIHMTPTQPPAIVGITPLLTSLSMSSYPGDVYPDNKAYIDSVFKTRLCGATPTCIPQYDVLVVGSEVTQSSLTTQVTKDAIKAWVLAGGTLIVFGSDSQNFQWLQPLFAVGQSTVNGGAFAPDVSHPLLHEPNTLDWDAYDNHGFGWDIKDIGSGAHYSDFTHVVVEGGEDVLAVSNTGAFGAGRIFLTTFRAGEIAGLQGNDEAMGFVANILLYTQRTGLYLEYGPTVPDGVQVTAAIRQSLVFDEKLGAVPVRLELHLWNEG
jgi:hypothetical protein